ncbi:MAG: Dabb family protein [Rhizobiaceae bacterium]
MIRHCVFVDFNDDVTTARRDEVFGLIDELKHHLPGILAVHIGANVSPEEGMDKGFSDGFIVDFADAASRDTYLVDERHRAAGAQLVASAKGGAAGILVYDMEIPGKFPAEC